MFGLKNCDSCRKAIREMISIGQSPQMRDIRTDGPDNDQLAAIADAVGDAMINRRSTTWRGLDEGDRALPVASLAAKHPSVIKRPVIISDNAITVGWSSEVAAAHGF